jgi:glycosyltransferase involved in cell wall biosynthesis
MSHLPNILVLTSEGLQTHTGGLGTYINELNNRFRDFQDARITFFEIPTRGEYLFDPTFDRGLARLITNADIIHANDYFTGYAALLRRGKSKLVTTIHMLHQRFTYSLDDFFLSQSQIQLLENQVVSCSDLLIAVSHHVANELASLPVRLPKLVVIHNAAGENFFAAVAPERGKELRLGIFTRLVPQKGIMEIPDFQPPRTREGSHCFQEFWDFHNPFLWN